MPFYNSVILIIKAFKKPAEEVAKYAVKALNITSSDPVIDLVQRETISLVSSATEILTTHAAR